MEILWFSSGPAAYRRRQPKDRATKAHAAETLEFGLWTKTMKNAQLDKKETGEHCILETNFTYRNMSWLWNTFSSEEKSTQNTHTGQLRYSLYAKREQMIYACIFSL